jgi:hypothetical protein
MKWKRLIIGIIGFLVLLFFLLPIAFSRTPLGAMLTILPGGWWRFLKRNVPQLAFDWGLIGTGIICSILVLLVGHWFMVTLFGQFRKASDAAKPLRQWRWSWTFGLYATVWILFLTAFGASGVLRHATWLLKVDQPWYEERLNSYTELRMADGMVEQLLLENDEDLEKSRRAILTERGYRRARNPICEDFNVILCADSSNKVAAYLIIPRNPKLLAKGYFAVSSPDTSEFIRPLSQLQDTLMKMEARYPTKVSH